MELQVAQFVNNKESHFNDVTNFNVGCSLTLEKIKQVEEIIYIKNSYFAPKRCDFINAFIELNIDVILEAIQQKCTTGDVARWMTKCGVEAKASQVKTHLDVIANSFSMAELKKLKINKAKSIINYVDNCSISQLDEFYNEIYRRDESRKTWDANEFPIICYIKAVSEKKKSQDKIKKLMSDQDAVVNNESLCESALDEEVKDKPLVSVDMDSDIECVVVPPAIEENCIKIPAEAEAEAEGKTSEFPESSMSSELALSAVSGEKTAAIDDQKIENVDSPRWRKWLDKVKFKLLGA